MISLHSTVRLLVRLVLCAGPFVAVGAQQSSPPPQPQGPPSKRVAPGDTSLRPGGIRPDTLTYALTGFRDGDEIPVGTIVDVLTRDAGDAPMLRRTMTVQRSQAKLIDSSVTDSRSLAPRQHRSMQPQRQIRIDFSGRRVRGTIGPADGPGVAIDTTLSTSVFDSSNWDLVVRSMPLAPGYAAVFRVYDLETGMHDYVVRVVGTTPMYGENAHIVLFQLSQSVEITVWIGDTTRRLLQVETPLGPTTVLRQTLRVAPRPPG